VLGWRCAGVVYLLAWRWALREYLEEAALVFVCGVLVAGAVIGGVGVALVVIWMGGGG
jgi:hypothetical protein